ncbi:MAG: hypothetical protein ACLGIB_12390 [Actinomycetota bacterium]
MRLWIALATALCLLLPTGATARPAPGAGGGLYQMAEADWLDLKARTFYFAIGVRGADAPGGVRNQVFVGRGNCEVHRSRELTMVACSGRGYGGDAGVDGFQMDPALSSAHLELSAKGYEHVVDWTGEDIPMSGAQAAGGGGLGADASAGAARWAPAEGTLFGKRLRSGGDFAFGALVEAAGAYVFADGAAVFAEGRSVRFGRDGVVRMNVTYRIPR